MKMLPMLDHVMLWVARGVAALFLFTGCGALIGVQSLPPDYPHKNLTGLALGIIWVFLLLIGLWYLPNRIVRAFIALSGAVGIVSIGIDTAEVVEGTWETDPFLFEIMVVSINAVFVLCFASLIWVALRPPKPFSSPNPVNLVNPV